VVLGKNIWGPWPLIIWEATTNEQNYCVQLSSIKQLMYRNYPENLGGLGKIWGACAPLAPT